MPNTDIPLCLLRLLVYAYLGRYRMAMLIATST